MADLLPLGATEVMASEPPVQRSSHLGGGLRWSSQNSCQSPDLASTDLPSGLLQFNFSKYLLAANTRTDALAWEFRKYETVPAFQRQTASLGSNQHLLKKTVKSEQSLGLGTDSCLGPEPVPSWSQGLRHTCLTSQSLS